MIVNERPQYRISPVTLAYTARLLNAFNNVEVPAPDGPIIANTLPAFAIPLTLSKILRPFLPVPLNLITNRRQVSEGTTGLFRALSNFVYFL